MASILTPAQKRLYIGLLWLGGVLLVTSGFLFFAHPAGESLPAVWQWTLVVHVAGGLFVLVPMAAFIFAHLKRAMSFRNRPAISTGFALAALGVTLAVTGLVILVEANSRQYRLVFRTHQIGALAVPLLFLGHRFLSRRNRPRVGRAALALGIMAGVVAAGSLGMALTGREPPPAMSRVPPLGRAASGGPDPFVPFRAPADAEQGSGLFPSPATAVEGLSAKDIAASCASCHPDVTRQWESSAHRFSSFNNPFYRVSVEDLRRQKGNSVSQWCGGCHDPALLFPGDMAGEIDPASPAANAGLTCLTCHAMESIHNVTGNGNYNLRDGLESPYLFSRANSALGIYLSERLVKAKPEVHKRQMLRPFLRTSEFCGACHKVSLDVPVNGYRFLRGQNEYDAWHDSGVSGNNPRTFYLPPVARNCQDCHMPRESAPLGDVSAKEGTVKSHRFLGANTALPHLRGDREMVEDTEAFLSDSKLRVDVFGMVRADGTTEAPLDRCAPELTAGETVTFEVVVRNLGVGHTFPGGTNDSNEAFLEFTVTDDAGREVFASGRIGGDGCVDEQAHFWRAVFVDEKGRRANRRNPQDFRTLVYANPIPPGSADVIRYEVKVPEGATSLTLGAAVKWRKFDRPYTEYVFRTLSQPVPDLPVTTVASARVTLPYAGAAATATPAAEFTRWNDHGIALLLQGDSARALESFRRVAEVAPERPDGYRNAARVLLGDGNTTEAREWLRKAEDKAPGDPRTAFFFGRLFRAEGQYDLSAEAFRRTLEAFPEDRGTVKELAALRFLDGDFAGALEVYGEALRIDPEDVDAHYHRMKCYEGLGREEEAAEARKAYLKYKEDDNARKRALSFLLSDEAMNREAQRIHVHR